MNQDIKERWVAALRSGDYKQTQERLRDANGFCCLGVLCDVVKDDMGVKWEEYSIATNDKCSNGFSFMNNNGELPPEVARFCGLPPSVTQGDVAIGGRSLISMNDNEFESFDTIADLIERHL